MPIGWTILLGILGGLSGGLLVFWSVVLYRLLRTVLAVPTARAGLRAPDRRPSTPRVCVVVPAHNEEAVIARHVRSLKDQDYPALSVVLALDRCTDRTAEIARQAIGGDQRFTIVEVRDCPPDWAGKVNAVWTGVNGAKSARNAEVLLFADADTTLSAPCVSATVSMMLDRALDLLSLVSTLTGTRWYELLAQPAAGFELIRQYPLVKANRENRRRPFANGQFMMFRAEAYRAVGGHQAVKDELLEDLALARLMARSGRRLGVFLADGVMTCRMYAQWPAFRKGWKRIYTESTRRRTGRLERASWQMRLTGTLMPLAAAALAILAPLAMPGEQKALALGLVALAGAGLAAFLAALGWIYRLSHAPLWTVPGYIAGSWIVGSILSEAARDLKRGTPTSWGGRSYVREVR